MSKADLRPPTRADKGAPVMQDGGQIEIVKAWESSNASRTLLVSIPKSVKEKLNLGKGSRFVVRVERGRIIFKPFKLKGAFA